MRGEIYHITFDIDICFTVYVASMEIMSTFLYLLYELLPPSSVAQWCDHFHDQLMIILHDFVTEKQHFLFRLPKFRSYYHYVLNGFV